jgi:hypothetical protein
MNGCPNLPNGFTTVPVDFTTTDQNGAAVAPSAAFVASDVNIYKNGSATQKTTTNGLTMTSPFDSITGLHLLLIDTSNNTGDTGFWSAGSIYTVVLAPPTTTVAGQAVVRTIAVFTLDVAGATNVTQWNGGAVPTPNQTGVPIIDLKYILGTVLTETAGQIAAAFKKFFNIATPTATMDHLVLVDTATSVTNRVTANTDQLAGQTVTAAAGVTFPASVASPTNITAGTITNLTNAPTNGDFTTAMKTSLNAATPASVVGSVGSVTDPVTLNNVQGIKKNTALAKFEFAMFDTSGNPKTGLQASLRTAGNSQCSIDGSAFADLTNIATITEIADGWYWVDLAAADLNGTNIGLRFAATGARELDFMIHTVLP